MTTTPEDRIARVARDVFGWAALRPGQREAIEAVLGGRDTLGLMASGFGKSAIYEIAGVLLEHATLVISPLIALQQDQVASIDARLPGEAAPLNSRLGVGARRKTLGALEDGSVEFLFLAPEQLANPEVLEELGAVAPSLVVVDEAHCISEWGHDFRPDYLRIGPLVEQLGHPTVLALTATASPPVRREIVERLGMRDPDVIVRGFDRPNIHLAVERHYEPEHKEAALVRHVLELEKPGIVYAATRRSAEDVAATLVAHGLRAAAYHAGLGTRARDAVQNRFMEDELEVVVATTAFGMGVDKPNVRFVVHHDASESLDAYYQEIGRAGRDGRPAKAILLYRSEDLGLRRFLRGSGPLTPDDLDRVARWIAEGRSPLDPAELGRRLHLSHSRLTAAVNRLQEAGEVVVDPDGGLRPDPNAPSIHEAVARAIHAEQNRAEFAESRLEMLQGYAEQHDTCRRQVLLSYFGEAAPAFCGNCDVDDRRGPPSAEAQAEAAAAVADGLAPGTAVTHKSWGTGEIQRVEHGHVVVLFEHVGYKTLALDLVREHGLLQPA